MTGRACGARSRRACNPNGSAIAAEVASYRSRAPPIDRRDHDDARLTTGSAPSPSLAPRAPGRPRLRDARRSRRDAGPHPLSDPDRPLCRLHQLPDRARGAGDPQPPGARGRHRGRPGHPRRIGRTARRGLHPGRPQGVHPLPDLPLSGAPPRRAFFMAHGDRRVVYTFLGDRLEEDLRHEATHALLHVAVGVLPLWLDEGLAEYFEGPDGRQGVNSEHLARLPADLASGWKPDLARLETLKTVRQMTPRDYRESWAWAHYLLNGSESGKAALLDYLDGLRTKPDARPLTERLSGEDVRLERPIARPPGSRTGPRAGGVPRRGRASRPAARSTAETGTREGVAARLLRPLPQPVRKLIAFQGRHIRPVRPSLGLQGEWDRPALSTRAIDRREHGDDLATVLARDLRRAVLDDRPRGSPGSCSAW